MFDRVRDNGGMPHSPPICTQFLTDPSLAQERPIPKWHLHDYGIEIFPYIPQPVEGYSYFSATMGSTLVARRAGK
jgi:hypothetical protein